jgi:hypothetical protein
MRFTAAEAGKLPLGSFTAAVIAAAPTYWVVRGLVEKSGRWGVIALGLSGIPLFAGALFLWAKAVLH